MQIASSRSFIPYAHNPTFQSNAWGSSPKIQASGQDTVHFASKSASRRPHFSGLEGIRKISRDEWADGTGMQTQMEELASKGGDIKQLLTILHNNAQKYNSLMLNKPNLMHINKTPLMRAIQNGNFDQARLLVAYGALFCPRSERDRIKIPQDMLGYKATDYIESALMGHGEKAEQFRQELADIQELHLLETSFFVPADFVAPFEKYSLDLVESVLENKERPDPKRYIDAWEREQAQTAEAPSLEVASASTPRSRSRSGSEDLTTESGSPEPVSPPQQYIG